MKVLLSAYACEPGQGSEPGVGWNVARHLATRHDVWVLTRSNNRPAIDRELRNRSCPTLKFVYYDLPEWMRWWKRGPRGLRTYYYLWQAGAYLRARQVHRQVGFDVVHHVTFVKYWTPSFLALLPVPFVWGPVGGGESAPRAFWSGFGLRGWLYESSRVLLRWLSEHDPFVRMTARRCAIALATTVDTTRRLRRLGVTQIHEMSEAGLPADEIPDLRADDSRSPRPIRFLSLGRLLHWKGFHLGLQAFSVANLDDSEYWIIGAGPDGQRLEALSVRLGLQDRVTFWGSLSRPETLEKRADCHVLVHPSLHDSGGWVCLEAMAAGLPVICLDLGGPATQVTEETGVKIRPGNPDDVVRELAEAMQRLARDHETRTRMGCAALRRVDARYQWESKALELDAIYQRVASGPPRTKP